MKTAQSSTSKPKRERRPKQTLFKLRQQSASDAAALQAYERARRRKYRDLFDTMLGREVLADYLAAVGVFSADEAHAEAIANHRNGARWAGFEILRACGADDADVLTRVVLSDDVSEVFHEE